MPKNLSAYLLCPLIALLVFCLYLGDFTGMKKLEWRIDDLMYSVRGQSNPIPDIVLVNIDDKSMDAYGRWPWSYDVLADAIAACNSAGPRSMLINLELPARVGEDTLGHTQVLANQISWSDNLVLSYDIALGEYSHQRLSRPEYLYASAASVNSELGLLDEQNTLNIRKPILPSDFICEYADGLGFDYVEYAPDRTVRWARLAANYDGYYYPSAALLVSALHLGYKPEEIKITGGESVSFGQLRVPTDEYGRVFINFNSPQVVFPTYSMADIMDEKINLSNLKGKMLIVTVAGISGQVYKTPVSPELVQGELLANVTDNILHNNYINRLDFSTGTNFLILIGLGFFCAFILPRVALMYRMVILLVCLIILGNLNYILFSSYNLLPCPLYVALEIILLMGAAPLFSDVIVGTSGRFSLTAIWERFTKNSPSKKPKASTLTSVPIRELRDTGNEPEFQKTEVVSLESQPPQGKPVEQTRAFDHNADTVAYDHTPKPPRLEQKAPIEPSPASPAAAPDLSDDLADEMERAFAASSPKIASAQNDLDRIESLGRYKIVGILGKGAMGTVFQGIDPAINRPVALKTIRLDFVADEQEMNELRDRLFREAQAAGKLSHPNIVTIYDVGSEGILQYIAMEYLEGQVLEQLIKRKVQFSYKIIANIIVQICNALDYAHDQGIIHRDIKPANIMILKDYSVKVMDFGIARVDSSSMTKTGIAMGTPNYIAPELLQGKEVDRRCDLFSLGVVVYELLTGRRPFRGENMTSLIYSIVNSQPTPPSSINENIPVIFDHIVANALKKNPNERYQKAADMRKALLSFVDSFNAVKH